MFTLVKGRIMALTVLSLVIGIIMADIISKSLVHFLVASEVMAKCFFVIDAYHGRPPSKGMGYFFIEYRGDQGVLKLLISTTLSMMLIPLLVGVMSSSAHLTSTAWFTALLTLHVAHKALGCVTRDVLGAIDEISRMTTLLVMEGAIG